MVTASRKYKYAGYFSSYALPLVVGAVALIAVVVGIEGLAINIL